MQTTGLRNQFRFTLMNLLDKLPEQREAGAAKDRCRGVLRLGFIAKPYLNDSYYFLGHSLPS